MNGVFKIEATVPILNEDNVRISGVDYPVELPNCPMLDIKIVLLDENVQAAMDQIQGALRGLGLVS